MLDKYYLLANLDRPVFRALSAWFKLLPAFGHNSCEHHPDVFRLVTYPCDLMYLNFCCWCCCGCLPMFKVHSENMSHRWLRNHEYTVYGCTYIYIEYRQHPVTPKKWRNTWRAPVKISIIISYCSLYIIIMRDTWEIFAEALNHSPILEGCSENFKSQVRVERLRKPCGVVISGNHERIANVHVVFENPLSCFARSVTTFDELMIEFPCWSIPLGWSEFCMCIV